MNLLDISVLEVNRFQNPKNLIRLSYPAEQFGAQWRNVDDPAGSVVNSYNDGPLI